jgi:hypothetical protein
MKINCSSMLLNGRMIDRAQLSLYLTAAMVKKKPAQLERPPSPLGTAYNVLIPHPFDETFVAPNFKFSPSVCHHPAMKDVTRDIYLAGDDDRLSCMVLCTVR